MTYSTADLIRIVDDDASICEAQSFFLRLAGFDVVSYCDALQFLSQDDFSRPGCLILDVRMPHMSGIELQHRMKTEEIDLPILFLSAHGDIEMALEAMKNGAFNFLVKPPVPEKLLDMVRSAVEKNHTDRRQAHYIDSLKKQFDTLTAAEIHVALMISKGLTNKTAADALGISERTVQTHRANVYAKLDCQNAVELSEFFRDLQPQEFC